VPQDGDPRLLARDQRQLDRHRAHPASPRRREGGPRPGLDRLDPGQLRADPDRREVQDDGRDLRRGRRPEELHQRFDRHELHLRPGARARVRGPGHDRGHRGRRALELDPL
jgi:hypothetical protein